MAKRVGVDKWLFGTVLLLVLFGLVMVFSASAVMAKATVGSPYAFVRSQAVRAQPGDLGDAGNGCAVHPDAGGLSKVQQP
jgi:cell division protein FtsW (lipid II flippase)